MRFFPRFPIVSLLFIVGLSHVSAATIYNEAISGDLSNSGLSPTSLTLALGSNQIFGTTGRTTAGMDRDYFTIAIPSGFLLTALSILPGTTSGGATSFIGLQAGNQVTVSTSATEATGLLGWWHYGPADINTNILPEMAVPAMGSSGFSVPLTAGSYSFWVQDFNTGTFNYGFDLAVAQAPEPATYMVMLLGLALVACLRSNARKTPQAASPQTE